jgi:hypothetical protein
VTPAVNEIEVVDAEEVVPAPEVVSPIDQPLQADGVSKENEPAVLFHLDADRACATSGKCKGRGETFCFGNGGGASTKPVMRSLHLPQKRPL